ncbi:hypothetical protein PoB_006206500 [Plakobranchus ocellatus]|uniref:Uncharacterized protein n=1 Tax=Plakobranchus ocellatus TaxID=259542 RepID=A0AAV4CUK5_9GAST|nr:hypothetical protein PoB_006206500 [Plakobranchus ocellatus]
MDPVECGRKPGLGSPPSVTHQALTKLPEHAALQDWINRLFHLSAGPENGVGDSTNKTPKSGASQDTGARTRDRRIPANLKAGSLSSLPPTPLKELRNIRENDSSYDILKYTINITTDTCDEDDKIKKERKEKVNFIMLKLLNERRRQDLGTAPMLSTAWNGKDWLAAFCQSCVPLAGKRASRKSGFWTIREAGKQADTTA